MKRMRILLVVLGLALAAAGFVNGYLLRDYLTRPGPPPPPPAPPPTQAAASGPAARAEGGPANEPSFEISEESGVGRKSPLYALMGVSYLARYENGPAKVHVEFFVDFEKDGVKKRAFFQAFNIGDESQRTVALDRPEPNADGYFDLAKSRGAVVLDMDLGLGLRTAHEYKGSGPKGDFQSGLYTSWDVFESYSRQGATEPKQALVLDYDACEKSGKKACYRTPDFHDLAAFRGPEIVRRNKEILIRGIKIAGQDGVGVLSLEILSTPNKAAATEETAAAEVAKLRKDLAATPDDAELKWGLARALDQRAFLKERTPETEYPLAEEAVNLLREATKQEPGNVFYRAELRKLLFRQASLTTEGKHAGEFAKILEEIESLVPLYDSEYTDAAALLEKWKNPELDKDLPEGQKKRIIRETDAKVVTLLRRHAEIWQMRPEEIETKLATFKDRATGKSYADTPEFKALLEDMRGWVKKKN